MKMHNAPAILKEVLAIAPDAWLFGATLLGAIREGKIISWDRDIDLGYPAEKVDEDLLHRFREAGFHVSGEYRFNLIEMHEYIPEAVGQFGKFILRKNGVKIEICCFAKGKDLPDRAGDSSEKVPMLYYASGTPRFFVLPESFVYPLTEIRIYDFMAKVPEKAHEQLAFVYGEDWRTPKQEWYFTPEHYLRREHTIIELRPESDGTRWSKWTGREVIDRAWGPQEWSDINTPPDRLLIKEL